MSKAQHQQLMQVNGSQTPELLGIVLEELSLLSAQSNKLKPIPFQFSEVNTEGYTFFSKVNIAIDGVKGSFDKNDKLIFLLRDAGPRFSNGDFSVINANIHTSKATTQQIISEIEIDTTTGKRYVYVSQNRFLTTQYGQADNDHDTMKSFVSYDKEKGMVSTDFYTLQVEPKNPINWRDFNYSTFTDKTKTSILDTLKIRLDGGVFNRFVPLHIDNGNLKAKIVDIQHGPLITTLLLKTKVVVASIPVMKMLIYFEIMPQEIGFNARIHIPKVAKRVLINPKLSISLDGNDLKGSIMQTAMMPGLIAHVDGKLSSTEKKLLKSRLSNDNNWIWFSTQKGFDMFAFMSVPEKYNIPIDLLYQDSDTLSDKPERFQGQGPNIGFRMSKLPSGTTLHVSSVLVFTDNIGNMTPQQFAEEIKTQPPIHSQSNAKTVASVAHKQHRQ
ncbi:MAG: hypothetical protein JKY24_04155 [Pseudomonadales bacterium]|nr:hypothetical protein [Pseudomonadales bacterium]